MAGDRQTFGTDKTYSPLTLNNEWPTLLRLILIILSTVVGTIVNGFFVSSFFISRPLKKAGNVYLACSGLADMIITTGVIPTAAVVMISKVWEIPPVCYSLQFLTQTSTYAYSLLFLMVAVETYLRLCWTRACYVRFLAVLPVGYVSFVIFAISFVASGIGVYFGMDYDYCTRKSHGNETFKLITSIVFHGIPLVLTTMMLVYACLVVRARAHRLFNYRRSQQYDNEYAFNNLNIVCYALYVGAWVPYLIIVNKYPDTTDDNFYHCVWLGMSRSVITGFLYGGLNKDFRRAFAHLFYYCCCKSTRTSSFNNRHRRFCEYRVATGDVRVHILHPTAPPNLNRLAGDSIEI